MKNVLLAVSVIGLLAPIGLSGQSTSPRPWHKQPWDPHEVEVFPFITFNYGLGDGWTSAAGR